MVQPLYDLTELQRHANRLFGFSAQQTLDVAQALYERHELISYPRPDSRHLAGQTVCTNAAAETNQRNRYTENLRRWARHFDPNISRSVSHLYLILAPLGTGDM
jgi:DNA topoisomerase IA